MSGGSERDTANSGLLFVDLTQSVPIGFSLSLSLVLFLFDTYVWFSNSNLQSMSSLSRLPIH